jgi:hypothetical protein
MQACEIKILVLNSDLNLILYRASKYRNTTMSFSPTAGKQIFTLKRVPLFGTK